MAADCRAVETTPSVIVAHSAPVGEDICGETRCPKGEKLLAHGAQMVGRPCGAANPGCRRLLAGAGSAHAAAKEPPKRRLQPGLAAPRSRRSLPQDDLARRHAAFDFHLLGGLPPALLDHDGAAKSSSMVSPSKHRKSRANTGSR